MPVVLVGALAFGLDDDEPARRPAAGPAPVARVQTPKPSESNPTFGKYVPPKPEEKPPAPPVRTVKPTAPKVRDTPTRRPRQPEYRRSCPPSWQEIPFLRRWCERNGHRSR
ncbi:hypothetical protein ACIBF1_22815 [Spirillospora sp. NPDC050679]